MKITEKSKHHSGIPKFNREVVKNNEKGGIKVQDKKIIKEVNTDSEEEIKGNKMPRRIVRRSTRRRPTRRIIRRKGSASIIRRRRRRR